MKKKKEELNEEIENKENCGCASGEECTCGDNCECDDCNCGEECSCGETCDCDDCSSDEGDSCTHDCMECPGCSGEFDPEMLITLLDNKNRELEDKNIRLQAEFLNYKTRTQGEIARMLKYEGEDFIKELLVIKDNLERAVILDDNDLSDEVSKFLSGIKLILGNLTSLFDKFEIKEVECLGKEFDPNVAEAVITEHNDEKPENVVLEVYTKGYMYKDKLIRPAMVKVNK